MKIGFIGCGNMGSAIATAAAKQAHTQGYEILLANRTPEKAQALAATIGARAVDNATIAETCDFIFLCVKPFLMADMLAELSPLFHARRAADERFVLVSMAAGLTMTRIAGMVHSASAPIIRMMPNTPSLIGEGMIQYCAQNVSEGELDAYRTMLAPAGTLDALEENLIDAASAVSGSGPAWAYQFIEALADGGVACGLPRQKAMQYAAQMLAGSAKLVLESGQHPGALKDAVCSPKGSTIQGVRVLESRAFRGAVTDAVCATFEKNREMGKE